MSLLDALVPSRRRALEEELETESAARVAAEAELARAQDTERCAREDLAHAHRVIRGMTYDLDDAQQAEERLTEELFEARDEVARIREGLANCAHPSGDADIATTLGQIILLKDALLVASEHATDGWREQYRALYEQIVDRALDALGLPEHDQVHQGLRAALRTDRDVAVESVV